MSSGIIFSIGANHSNLHLGEGRRGSTHSLTPPTNTSAVGVNAQPSAAAAPHKTFVHENDRHTVLDDDWFLAAHRGKEALAPNRGPFGDTAPSGSDIGSDAHTLAAATAAGGRSAGRTASPKQAPWWKRMSASFGGGKPLMASSADNLLGEEMGAGDAVTSAAAYRARRKAASRTSASSADPHASPNTLSPAIPATKATVTHLGPTLPQDPDSVSAWHHTDCDSYLLNYEQCLADNKFDLSAGGRCRGAWDAFAACKNDGRL